MVAGGAGAQWGTWTGPGGVLAAGTPPGVLSLVYPRGACDSSRRLRSPLLLVAEQRALAREVGA